MNAYFNYLLEASLGFVLFAVVYHILLRNETNFTFKRLYILIAFTASLLFPLVTLTQTATTIPSLQYSIETVDLNYDDLETETTVTQAKPSFNVWQAILYIYIGGTILSLMMFLYRIYTLVRAIRMAVPKRYNGYTLIELPGTQTPFSFFRYVFIGNELLVTETEKQKIIEHELVHASLYHSADIILINVVGIIFWFNPVLITYKKILVQVHEFEADARAVEKHDVNEYCSLLAKVALRAVNFSLANHFSNSLIPKRIEMMRTLKQKLKSWKIIAVAVVLPVFFVIVACQDQVLNEVKEIAANSNMAVDYPKEVQAKVAELKAKNPGMTYIVIEPDENTGLKAENLKKKMDELDPQSVNSIQVMRNIVDESGISRSFVIIEYNDKVQRTIEFTQTDGVYAAVEQAAEPVGGFAELKKFIADNFDATIPGKVFVQFIVHEDGSLSDFTIVKGVSEEADREALRVAKLFPKWNPGKQNGQPVKSRYVLPIGAPQSGTTASGVAISQPAIQATGFSMDVTIKTERTGNEWIVTGTVRAENKPLAGATVLIYKGSKGTSTDSEGNFTLRVPAQTEKIAISFIGFETKVIAL